MSRAALELFEKHAASLRAAGQACRERSYFTLFPETPDRHRGGAAASAAGIAAFNAQLGRAFELDQPGTLDRIGGVVVLGGNFTRQLIYLVTQILCRNRVVHEADL